MRRFRLLTLSCAALLVVASTQIPSPVGAAQAMNGGPSDAQSSTDTATAAKIAKLYGHPVEDTSQTTATAQVFAQADGSFRLIESSIPVRVRRNGGWTPVDLALVSSADGTLEPTATPAPVKFSGGGASAVAQIQAPNRSWVSQKWNGRLPAPKVDGASATYADVFPGVDLTMTATVTGFSQVLVVKSAKAAANPALRSINLAVSSSAPQSAHASGGGMDLLSKFGSGVHVGPATWWDSSQPDASTDGPGGPGIERVTPARYSASSIVLDASTISATPNLHYPLFIDPSYGWTGQIASSKTAYTFVDSAYPTTGYWNGSHPDGYQHVGYINAANAGGTSHKTRAFWRMDTSAMAGKHILSAAFNTFEIWSSSCNKTTTNLYSTGAISSSTTWNAQPAWASARTTYGTFAYGWSPSGIGGSSSCTTGGHAVGFNVLPLVVSAAKARAATTTLGLRADNESDWYSWKKFKGAATLDITYNTVPNVPTSLRNSSNTACVTGSSRPIIGTLTPTFYATATDTDKGNVRVEFEWWVTGGSAKVGSALSASLASGSTTFAASVPSGKFTSGQNMSWRARTYDGTDYSGYTGWCELHLDTTAPKPPTVTSASTEFPDYTYFRSQNIDPPTPPKSVGDTGTVTFGANGSTDVAYYWVSVNGRPFARYTPSSAGGDYTLTLAPGLPDSWIDVYTYDTAGNKSTTSNHYEFPLKPSASLAAQWSIVGPDTIDANGQIQATTAGSNALTLKENTSVTQSTSSGSTIYDTNSGPTLDQDDLGNFQLDFDGVNDYAQSASAAVDTTGSYTVVAQVRPAALKRGTYQTAVTQWGTSDSAFYLQFDPNGAMRFALTNADASTRTATIVAATTADIVNPAKCGIAKQNTDPTADNYYDENAWHTVVGAFDKSDNQMLIWVDDCPNPIAQTTAPVVWKATGSVGIGTAWNNAQPIPSNMYGGGVQDVLMFSGVPTSDMIVNQIGAARA